MARQPKKSPLDDVLAEIKQRMSYDETLLSDEEKEAAYKIAAEHVVAARKEKAMVAFQAKAIREIEQQLEPTQQVQDVHVDLPGHSYRIALDGICYYHGVIYPVPTTVAQTLKDIMGRAWEHEHEIGGANSDEYRRRPAGIQLRPGDERRPGTAFGLRGPVAV